MSYKGRLKPNRNLAILVARGMAECQPGKLYRVDIYHDGNCPVLEGQSMLLFRCKPLIKFEEL